MFIKLFVNFYLFLLFFVNFIFAENIFQESKNESNNNKQLLNFQKLPVEVALCEGSASAFFVSDNINIIDNNPSAIIRGINEQQCIEYCKNNKDKNGRTLLCSLIIYRIETQECRIFKRTTFPDGDLIRQSSEGYRLIEKFCLTEEISMECANKEFIRVDNYILRGYAQSTITVPTLSLCVNECIKEKEFNCLSAIYFYEEGECITNTESAITAPDDFQPPEDDDKKVVFFHNSCINNKLFSSSSSVIENNKQIELSQSQDSAITTSALIQDEITTSSKVSTSLSPLLSENITSTNLNNNNLFITEENNSFLLENNNKEKEQNNNNLISETTIIPKTEINKEENIKNNINPSIISSSFFVSPEEEKKEEEKENIQKQQIILPKVFLPQKDEKINNNLNEEKSKKEEEEEEEKQQKRQYGAKIIERASDGSFQEKIIKINSSSLLINNNNNNSTKSTIFNNKKGPESTKKLNLKLIKDLNQKTNNNIKTFTTTTINSFLPLKILKNENNLLPFSSFLPTTTIFTNLKENKKHENNNKQFEEFIPLELGESLNNEQSAEEHFDGSEGYFSLWGPWTPCNIPGERKIRRRKCLDLKKCRGSLTQIDYCPNNNYEEEEEIINENKKQINELLLLSTTISPPLIIENNKNNKISKEEEEEKEEPKPPGITPSPSHEIEQKQQNLNKQQKQFGILTSKNENIGEIWSKWNGTCQHFASSQPCKDGQIIGFESRECIAKDPLMCKGPFFRYCTLPC